MGDHEIDLCLTARWRCRLESMPFKRGSSPHPRERPETGFGADFNCIEARVPRAWLCASAQNNKEEDGCVSLGELPR
jgi:hypothetical protein